MAAIDQWTSCVGIERYLQKEVGALAGKKVARWMRKRPLLCWCVNADSWPNCGSRVRL